MPPAVVGVITAVSAIGGLALSAFSSIEAGNQRAAAIRAQAQAGQAEAGVATYNQQLAEQEAIQRQQAGDQKQQQLKLQQTRMKGAVAANIGASGLTGAGTPLEVMNENTRLMEMDQLTQEYNTAVGVSQAKSAANLYGYEAAVDRAGASTTASMAPGATTSGYLTAGSTLLGGAYKFFGPTTYRPSFGPDLSGSEMMTGASY